MQPNIMTLPLLLLAMPVSRLESFREAYRNLDLKPLIHQNELTRFRVEYGGDVLVKLQQLVEDSDTQDSKIIFAGHTGCGKSTLLAEFGRQCQERGYFVSRFSIAASVEMSDIDHINILFAIAINLMLEAEKQDIAIPASTQKQLNQWFATKTQIQSETPISTEVSAGFDLFKLISGKLKTEASIRTELRREFERNISDLVARLNEIAATIQGSSGYQVLVIIDDLDKLDLGVVRLIFQDHIKALFSPGFQIIFTIPIASRRDKVLRATLVSESNDQIVEMLVRKLFDEGERRKSGITPIAGVENILCEMLEKRFPADLMVPEIGSQIVRYSGGVLRELIRIANNCCRICLRQVRQTANPEAVIINQTVLEEAIRDIRLDFETQLGRVDFEILQRTYRMFQPDDPQAQEFLDLLHSLHILEYRNARVWYDVHPVLDELLQRKQLI